MTLPPDADPSGFLERTPALASLMPDEALSTALSRGDALGLYAVLRARLAAEPSGPTREALAALVADRAAFVMAEPTPTLAGVFGFGPGLVGKPRADAPDAPFIATRAVRLLSVPVWPLSEHLVRRDKEGALQVVGRVPPSPRFGLRRAVAVSALAGVLLLACAAFVSEHLREVFLVNGLSRAVRVCVDGSCQEVGPESVTTERFFTLASTRTVEASWPGEAQPFETVELSSQERSVYLVLGAGQLQAVSSNYVGDVIRTMASGESVQVGERLVLRAGGWRAHAEDDLQPGGLHHIFAARRAERVALADPLDLAARELAARAWLGGPSPSEAVAFGYRLVARYPEDVAAQRLLADLVIAQGLHREQKALAHFDALASRKPPRVEWALLRARIAEADKQREAHEEVVTRFPGSADAMRALARVRAASGETLPVLDLLDQARTLAPESLEDVELRARVLVSRKRYGDASNEVRRFAQSGTPRSWEFAVLAGRVAAVVGPHRTQYVIRDLLPPEPPEPVPNVRVADYKLKGFGSPVPPANAPPAQAPQGPRGRARSLLFELSTGDGSVKPDEIEALAPGVERDALMLAYGIFAEPERALNLGREASDAVLSRLEPGAAALLALELYRLGERDAARRVMGSHLSLLLARRTLEAHVDNGYATGAFQLLPPGLRAAAHIIRARAAPQEAATARQSALAADSLHGAALRSFEAWTGVAPPETGAPRFKYQEVFRGCRREVIQIIKGGSVPVRDSAPAKATAPVTAPR
ncbi:hypothetical protein P2318_03405 [Myxococcaceae bacterium GXIMD 01537]